MAMRTACACGSSDINKDILLLGDGSVAGLSTRLRTRDERPLVFVTHRCVTKTRGRSSRVRSLVTSLSFSLREAFLTKILVTGGSGVLGREIVKHLAHMHYSIRALSRSPRPYVSCSSNMLEWVQGNLQTGQGLAEAVAGVDTIVHAASHPLHSRSVDVNGTRLLLAKAYEAGVAHIVYISIVGIDRITYTYYRSKLEAEECIQQSGIPWSILRATQFHSFIDLILQATTRLPLALFPTDFQIQTLDPGETAHRLCEMVVTGPGGRVPDLGGPEVLTGEQVLDTWLKLRGLHRLIVPLRLPGKTAHGFRHGYNTCASEPRKGHITWSEWVQKKYQK